MRGRTTWMTAIVAVALGAFVAGAGARTTAASARSAASSAEAAASSAAVASQLAASAVAALDAAKGAAASSAALAQSAAASAAEAKTSIETLAASASPMRAWILSVSGIVAGTLAFAALLFGVLAVLQARRLGHIRFRSHWGGFGGSGTGWELDPPAISLAVAGVFSLAACVIVSGLLQSTDNRPPAANDAAPAKSSKAAKSAH